MCHGFICSTYQGAYYGPLNESDVWPLSPTMQSRPISVKFINVLNERRASQPSGRKWLGKSYAPFWTMWATNSYDLR
jgi:hypothetical protein